MIIWPSLFVLCLQSWPFLGLVDEAASPNANVPIFTARLSLITFGFYFYKVLSLTAWPFGGITEGLAPLLRISAWFWECLMLPEWIQSSWRNWLIFPCEFYWVYCTDIVPILGASSLVSGLHLFVWLCCPYVIIMWNIIGPFVPFWKGIYFHSWHLYFVCFTLPCILWRSFLPDLFSCCPLTTKVSKGGLPFYLMVYLFAAVFPILVSSDHILNRSKLKKIVRNILHIFITNLPCHVVTFKSAVSVILGYSNNKNGWMLKKWLDNISFLG